VTASAARPLSISFLSFRVRVSLSGYVCVHALRLGHEGEGAGLVQSERRHSLLRDQYSSVPLSLSLSDSSYHILSDVVISFLLWWMSKFERK
jgi:hypothetical protein